MPNWVNPHPFKSCIDHFLRSARPDTRYGSRQLYIISSYSCIIFFFAFNCMIQSSDENPNRPSSAFKGKIQSHSSSPRLNTGQVKHPKTEEKKKKNRARRATEACLSSKATNRVCTWRAWYRDFRGSITEIKGGWSEGHTCRTRGSSTAPDSPVISLQLLSKVPDGAVMKKHLRSGLRELQCWSMRNLEPHFCGYSIRQCQSQKHGRTAIDAVFMLDMRPTQAYHKYVKNYSRQVKNYIRHTTRCVQ